MDELNEMLQKYNDATKPLVEWAQHQLNTPFAETKDGEAVLEHIATIAKGSAMLNLKVIMMTLQDVLVNTKMEEGLF